MLSKVSAKIQLREDDFSDSRSENGLKRELVGIGTGSMGVIQSLGSPMPKWRCSGPPAAFESCQI